MKTKTTIVLLLTIIFVVISGTVSAQALTGTKTIGSGGNYTTFTAAINALNTNGVGAGGVTFNVADGSVFAENIPVITATGTSDDPIVFQKVGTGNNPKITPSGTVGNADAGIVISGGDYITFDGIDINSSATAAVEYGYLIRNAAATNGAQHITIKNTNITMQTATYMGIYLYCSAIFQTSNSIGGGVTATSVSGANSYNHFYNLNIQNAISGIVLYGSSTDYRDTGCEIGTTSTDIRNVINNIGAVGVSSESRAIHFYRSEAFRVFNTDISNVQGLSGTDNTGIRAFEYFGTNYIYNNKITNVNNPNTSSSFAVGLWLEAAIYTAPTVYIYNNSIMNIRSSRNSVDSFYNTIGMRLGRGGDQTNEIFYVHNNAISMGYGLTPRCSTVAVAIMSWVSDYDIQNNVIANYARSYTLSTPISQHYGVYSYGRNLGDGITDWNVYYTPYGFIGIADTWAYSDMGSWQSLIMYGEDDHSIYTNPHFMNPDTDLHASAGRMMNLTGYTYPAYLTHDMDYQLRDTGTYAGADVFVPFDDTSTLTAPDTQIPAGGVSSIANTAVNAVDVFSFKISDIGTDGMATKVNTIQIANTNPYNSATWTSVLKGAILKVDGSVINAGTPVITNTTITFTLPTSVTIASGGNATFTLGIYLNYANALEDNKPLQFKILRTLHGCSTEGWGSRIADDIGAEVVSSLMYIDVIASFYWLRHPSFAFRGQSFVIHVDAMDIHGFIDRSADTVTMLLNTGTGTLNGGTASPLSNGTGSYILYYNKAETITILASGNVQSVTGNIVIGNSKEITSFPNAGGTGNQDYPFILDRPFGRDVAVYGYAEIGNVDAIESISWYVSQASYNALPTKIYLKNFNGTLDSVSPLTWQNLISSATLVYSGSQTFNAVGWKNIPLSTSFTNSGFQNLMVLVESDYGVSGGYAAQFAYHNTLGTSNHASGKDYGTMPNPYTVTKTNQRPNIRITFASPGQYDASTTMQSSSNWVSANAVNQDIIRVQVTVSGTLTPVSINSLTFNTTGTTNVADITAAKVYYTGTSATFSTTTQYGSTVTNLGSKGTFSVAQTQTLPVGTSYFWLCYNIGATPAVGSQFDAQCTAVSVDNISRTPTVTNPAGYRSVAGKKVSSITITQAGQGTTASGASNLVLLQLRIDVYEASDAGSYSSLPLNSISIRSKNTNDTDISAAKLFLGNDLLNQLGTNRTFAGGNAVFSSLNYELPIGTTTIKLYYDVSGAAGAGNVLDAKVLTNAINIAGNTYPATEQDPTGQYTIQNYNYGAGYAEQGGYYFANTLADPAPSMPTFNWIDISSTGTNAYPDMSSDNGAAPNNTVGYDIGFSFPFFGQSCTKFWIGADGAIFFSRPTFPPPMGINPNVIGLYAADFHPASPNYPKTILYQSVGDTMVITYLKCQPATGSNADNYLTGQIILFPNGKIKLQYLEKGSQTVINNAMALIANQTLTNYYMYHMSGQYGPVFGDNPIAVAFGQNAYMLGDNSTQNDLPVPASGTPTVTFANTGATVQFTTSTSATNLTAIRVEANPGGTLPDGILSLANRHWTINSTATTGLGNYNLTLNLSGITNLTAETVFYLVKREHVNSAWTNMGAPTVYDFPNRTATWQISNGFSDFGLGFEENQTLPVELTSFMAQPTATNSAVTLSWTTQSETGLSGYYVYRNTSAQLSDAVSLNQFIPAENSSGGSTYSFTDTELEGEGVYYYWLQSIEFNGDNQFFGPVSVTIEPDSPTPPVVYETRLKGIYPNPFNPDATISYSLKNAGTVKLDIFNTRGQLIQHQEVNHDRAGDYYYRWSAVSLASGLYFVRFTNGGDVQIKKAILSK